jgi:hypothetical protein
VRVTRSAEDSIEEELNYDEAFESYDSFVTEGSGGRCMLAPADTPVMRRLISWLAETALSMALRRWQRNPKSFST